MRHVDRKTFRQLLKDRGIGTPGAISTKSLSLLRISWEMAPGSVEKGG